jgi:hypothetical protein
MTFFLKNDDGTLFITRSDILDKWKIYFEQLFNCDDSINTFSWTNMEPNLSEHLAPRNKTEESEVTRRRRDTRGNYEEIK